VEKSDCHFKFEELGVYQKSIIFGEVCFKITSKFPKQEQYNLSSQFLRAADSISLNIAEGSSGSDPQFHKH